MLFVWDASIDESEGGMVDAVRVQLDWALASLIDDDTESSGGGSEMGVVSWSIFGTDDGNWSSWV